MNAVSRISYLTDILFGEGAVDLLAEEARGRGVTRPLVVTDAALVETGLVERATRSLGEAFVLHADPPGEPDEEAAMRALDVYRHAGCDALVAIGGGSSIDLAKAVGLLATHPGELVRYVFVSGGASLIGPEMPVVIAVPTTAGTGSEVGRAAVIRLRTGRKLAIISRFLIPQLAICDPELTYGMPPSVRAATGMDAISHCLETYLSPALNPAADALALDGLTRGLSSIRRCFDSDRDVLARREMVATAFMGALAFQKGLGAVHALSHAIGSLPAGHAAHGALNAILMPAVTSVNRSVCEGKLREVEVRLGESRPLEAVLADLADELPLPKRLGEMGLRDSDVDQVARWATQDHCHATNPRVLEAADYADLLRAAL